MLQYEHSTQTLPELILLILKLGNGNTQVGFHRPINLKAGPGFIDSGQQNCTCQHWHTKGKGLWSTKTERLQRREYHKAAHHILFDQVPTESNCQ